MSYTDVFGSQTLPPAEYGYSSLTLTADLTVVWPYNADSTVLTIAKITEIACLAGNALILPSAMEVSVGEDFLIRNTGSETLIVKDNAGAQIATVAVGAASYFYLVNNTTDAGVYGVIGFGVGTSTADAASLVGYGIKAIGASLNQSHPVIPVASSLAIDSTYRAKLVSFTGGTGTFSLTSAATLGDDYFVMIRNNGTGTLTIDPAGAETIDGQGTLQIQPSESLMLISTGTQWYSVGYGRSTLYQFTQLTKDVSAGGSFTLTAAEASNKLLTFIGSPAIAVTIIVPSVVSVYYTYSNISTAFSITIKTAAGSGTTVPQGARIIAICDGTNVMSAQSAVANSSVSLTDGSVTVPALFFSSQTNTGLFKYSTNGLGFSVNGVDIMHLAPTGATVTGALDVSGGLTLGTPLPIASGGTAAITASAARTNLGIPASIQGAEYLTLGTIAGNNTITAVATPVIAAYATGQTFRFTSIAANTGAVTLNVDSKGAKAVTKASSTGPVALVAGDIPAGGLVLQVTYDGTQFQLNSGVGSSSGGGGATGGGTDKAFFEGETLITEDYTIGQGAMTPCTVSIANPCVVTQGNTYVAEQPVRFTTTGTLPTGLDSVSVYYVIAAGLSTTSFQVSTTVGGSAVITTGTQSGVHSCGKIKNAITPTGFGVLTGKTVTVPTGATWTIP